MKSVYFVPYHDDNPYQAQLDRNLRLLGFEVSSRPDVKGMCWDWIKGKHRPDLVHLHWLPKFPSGLKGWRRSTIFLARLVFLRCMGLRFVWTLHNLYNHEAESRLIEKQVTKRVMAIVSRIIVHSSNTLELIRGEFGGQNIDKVVVVPHGNYVGVYENEVSKVDARAKLDLTNEGLVVLFLGNIRVYKGVKELVDAFVQIAGECNLLIAGRIFNEVGFAEIEHTIRGDKRISMRPGYVPDEEIQNYMNAADAVVFPYQEILTSGAVILAMSFRKACIAPRIGIIPDVLDDRGAILYHPDREGGLKEAISEAIDRSEELKEMGCHNFIRANEWGWDRVAAATAAVYRDALNGRCFQRSE